DLVIQHCVKCPNKKAASAARKSINSSHVTLVASITSFSLRHRKLFLDFEQSLMGSPEAEFVQKTISNNSVVIFSKTTCPYCRSTKRVFSELGVEPQVFELDRREDGVRVPRVFIHGKCVGGNSETQTLYKSGNLAEMLKNVSLTWATVMACKN
ncbi:GRXC4-like protein, partial [Mya arenaria]